MFSLKTIIKLLFIFFLSLFLIFSLIASYTTPYFESPFKQHFKSSIPKIEQFAISTLINQDFLDLPAPSPYNLYHLEEVSYEKTHFSQAKSRKDTKDHDFILFVPGHKGSHTQIIQLQGYLYNKFKDFKLESFYFKFFSIDFLDMPSAFSAKLLDSQADFIAMALKYLAHKCQKKKQKITIIAHSMGGIAVLLALRNLTSSNEHHYILNHIEKIIFLNSPLGNHPINLDFSLQSSYSKIYNFFLRKKSLGNIIFLSFSGNKGDIQVNREIARLNINQNFENYYHFLTNDLKGVYLHLTHVETLTNPFFLFKMSEFLIDFYVNKLNRITFNFFWYFQHLNRQIHSVKAKKFNETETFWETLANLTEFNVSKKTCKEKNGVSNGFYEEKCRVFNFNAENLRNLVIRTQNGLDSLRVYLFYRDSNEKIQKIVNLAPEYKFEHYPDLNFRYYYVIPDNFIQTKDSIFKLIIIKTEKNEKNYQILSEMPQNIHKTLGFLEFLTGTRVDIDLNGNFSLNIEFDTPALLDPLFLEFKVFLNSSKYKSNDVILLVFHWKDPEQNSTNLNEIQLLSSKNESFVRQELRYAKYKVLQIIFPYQKNATASIFINISIWELLHYIGRNSKQEVISMLYCVAFMVLLMQWWNLMEEKEIEGFLKKIWKNFGVIVFIWGNVNIFYWNMSQKILDFMGFYNGESEERYKLIIMSLLVPSVSLLGTMAFYIVFYVFFKIIELLAWVLCRILVKITKKRGFLLVFSIQMVFMAFSMIYEKKWILYPLALFLGVLGTLIKSENHENFPYEISKSCFFISFLYYLMNFGKILLLFEHFQRNDDILLEFLTEDDDFVKYLALVIWCFIGQFLNKMKIERKRMFLFGGLIFLMLFSMITLGIGRVYFINYILTYTAVLVIFLII